jgi:integrase
MSFSESASQHVSRVSRWARLPGSRRVTFEDVVQEWRAKRQREGLSDSTHRKDQQLLEQLACPALGAKRIDQIKPADILALLRSVEAKGNTETAHRLRSMISRIFRYAIATARCERDPAAGLVGALVAHRTTHHPALFEPKAIGALVRDLLGYNGTATVRLAMLLLMHTYVRPSELRLARWEEFDLERAVWSISGERMKMRRKHVVPLSRQVLGYLTHLKEITGAGDLLFPAVRGGAKPISDGTINAALRRMGYTKDEVVAHGFRRTASTILNESGEFSPDAIEMSLAHAPQGVRGIYNAAQYMPERVKIAQWYSDFLDRVAADG